MKLPLYGNGKQNYNSSSSFCQSKNKKKLSVAQLFNIMTGIGAMKLYAKKKVEETFLKGVESIKY